MNDFNNQQIPQDQQEEDALTLAIKRNKALTDRAIQNYSQKAQLDALNKKAKEQQSARDYLDLTQSLTKAASTLGTGDKSGYDAVIDKTIRDPERGKLSAIRSAISEIPSGAVETTESIAKGLGGLASNIGAGIVESYKTDSEDLPEVLPSLQNKGVLDSIGTAVNTPNKLLNNAISGLGTLSRKLKGEEGIPSNVREIARKNANLTNQKAKLDDQINQYQKLLDSGFKSNSLQKRIDMAKKAKESLSLSSEESELLRNNPEWSDYVYDFESLKSNANSVENKEFSNQFNTDGAGVEQRLYAFGEQEALQNDPSYVKSVKRIKELTDKEGSLTPTDYKEAAKEMYNITKAKASYAVDNISAEQSGRIVGNLVPFIASGLFGRAAGATSTASKLANLAVFGGDAASVQNTLINKLEAENGGKPLTDEQAGLATLSVAAYLGLNKAGSEAVINGLFNRLTKRTVLAGTKAVAKNVGKGVAKAGSGVLTEGVTEGVQQAFQDGTLVDKKNFDPEAVADSTIAGAIGAGALSGAGLAGSTLVNSPRLAIAAKDAVIPPNATKVRTAADTAKAEVDTASEQIELKKELDNRKTEVSSEIQEYSEAVKELESKQAKTEKDSEEYNKLQDLIDKRNTIIEADKQELGKIDERLKTIPSAETIAKTVQSASLLESKAQAKEFRANRATTKPKTVKQVSDKKAKEGLTDNDVLDVVLNMDKYSAKQIDDLAKVDPIFKPVQAIRKSIDSVSKDLLQGSEGVKGVMNTFTKYASAIKSGDENAKKALTNSVNELAAMMQSKADVSNEAYTLTQEDGKKRYVVFNPRTKRYDLSDTKKGKSIYINSNSGKLIDSIQKDADALKESAVSVQKFVDNIKIEKPKAKESVKQGENDPLADKQTSSKASTAEKVKNTVKKKIKGIKGTTFKTSKESKKYVHGILSKTKDKAFAKEAKDTTNVITRKSQYVGGHFNSGTYTNKSKVWASTFNEPELSKATKAGATIVTKDAETKTYLDKSKNNTLAQEYTEVRPNVYEPKVKDSTVTKQSSKPTKVAKGVHKDSNGTYHAYSESYSGKPNVESSERDIRMNTFSEVIQKVLEDSKGNKPTIVMSKFNVDFARRLVQEGFVQNKGVSTYLNEQGEPVLEKSISFTFVEKPKDPNTPRELYQLSTKKDRIGFRLDKGVVKPSSPTLVYPNLDRLAKTHQAIEGTIGTLRDAEPTINKNLFNLKAGKKSFEKGDVVWVGNNVSEQDLKDLGAALDQGAIIVPYTNNPVIRDLIQDRGDYAKLNTASQLPTKLEGVKGFIYAPVSTLNAPSEMEALATKIGGKYFEVDASKTVPKENTEKPKEVKNEKVVKTKTTKSETKTSDKPSTTSNESEVTSKKVYQENTLDKPDVDTDNIVITQSIDSTEPFGGVESVTPIKDTDFTVKFKVQSQNTKLSIFDAKVPENIKTVKDTFTAKIHSKFRQTPTLFTSYINGVSEFFSTKKSYKIVERVLDRKITDREKVTLASVNNLLNTNGLTEEIGNVIASNEIKNTNIQAMLNSPIHALIHPEGDTLTLDQTLLEAMSMGALDFINLNGVNNILSKDDLGKLIPSLENYSSSIPFGLYEQLNRIGLPEFTVQENIGNKVLSLLGINDTKDALFDDKELLAKHIGAIVMEAMVQKGMLVETRVSKYAVAMAFVANGDLYQLGREDYDTFAELYTAMFEGASLDDKSFSKDVRKLSKVPITKQLAWLQEKEDNAKLSDTPYVFYASTLNRDPENNRLIRNNVVSMAKDALFSFSYLATHRSDYKVITDLITPKEAVKTPLKEYDEKQLKVPDTLNKTNVKVGNKLKDRLEKVNKKEWKLESPLVNMLKRLRKEFPDSFKQILGIPVNTEEYLNNLNIGSRASQMSIFDGLLRDADNLLDFVGTDPAGQIYYLKTSPWSNQRVGIDNTLIDPTGSKLHRALITHDDFKTTLSKDSGFNPDGSITDYGIFLASVAEGLGDIVGTFKYPRKDAKYKQIHNKEDKVLPIDLLPEVQNYLDNSELLHEAVEGLKTLQDSKSSAEQVKAASEAVAAFLEQSGEHFEGLAVLNELIKYYDAKGKNFETSIKKSSDGITNGVMFLNTLMGIGDKELLEAGGILSNETTYQELLAKGEILDAYEQKARDATQESANRIEMTYANYLSNKIAKIDPTFGTRKGVKKIVTATNYMSMMRANIKSIVNSFHGKVQEKLDTITTQEELDSLKDSLSTLAGYHQRIYNMIHNATFMFSTEENGEIKNYENTFDLGQFMAPANTIQEFRYRQEMLNSLAEIIAYENPAGTYGETALLDSMHYIAITYGRVNKNLEFIDSTGKVSKKMSKTQLNDLNAKQFEAISTALFGLEERKNITAKALNKKLSIKLARGKEYTQDIGKKYIAESFNNLTLDSIKEYVLPPTFKYAVGKVVALTNGTSLRRALEKATKFELGKQRLLWLNGIGDTIYTTVDNMLKKALINRKKPVTKGELDQVNQILSNIAPKMQGGLSNPTRRDTFIQNSKSNRVTVPNKKVSVKVGSSNKSLNGTVSQATSAGVKAFAVYVQSLDSNVSSSVYSNFTAINAHDANITGIPLANKMIQKQNKAFLDTVLSSDLDKVLTDSLVNTFEGYKALLVTLTDPKTDLFGLDHETRFNLVSTMVNYLSITLNDIDSSLGLLNKEYDSSALDYFSEAKVVHQYGGLDQAYKLNPQDYENIQKANETKRESRKAQQVAVTNILNAVANMNEILITTDTLDVGKSVVKKDKRLRLALRHLNDVVAKVAEVENVSEDGVEREHTLEVSKDPAQEVVQESLQKEVNLEEAEKTETLYRVLNADTTLNNLEDLLQNDRSFTREDVQSIVDFVLNQAGKDSIEKYFGDSTVVDNPLISSLKIKVDSSIPKVSYDKFYNVIKIPTGTSAKEVIKEVNKLLMLNSINRNREQGFNKNQLIMDRFLHSKYKDIVDYMDLKGLDVTGNIYIDALELVLNTRDSDLGKSTFTRIVAAIFTLFTGKKYTTEDLMSDRQQILFALKTLRGDVNSFTPRDISQDSLKDSDIASFDARGEPLPVEADAGFVGRVMNSLRKNSTLGKPNTRYVIPLDTFVKALKEAILDYPVDYTGNLNVVVLVDRIETLAKQSPNTRVVIAPSILEEGLDISYTLNTDTISLQLGDNINTAPRITLDAIAHELAHASLNKGLIKVMSKPSRERQKVLRYLQTFLNKELSDFVDSRRLNYIASSTQGTPYRELPYINRYKVLSEFYAVMKEDHTGEFHNKLYEVYGKDFIDNMEQYLDNMTGETDLDANVINDFNKMNMAQTNEELAKSPTEIIESLVSDRPDLVEISQSVLEPLIGVVDPSIFNPVEGQKMFDQAINGNTDTLNTTISKLFNMNEGEKYTAEILNEAFKYYFKNIGKTNEYRRMQNIYSSIVERAHPSMFTTTPWGETTQQEQLIAVQKYNELFSATDSSEYLSKFYALVLVKPELQKAFERVRVKSDNDNSLHDIVFTNVSRVVDFVTDTYNETESNREIVKDMKSLAFKLNKISERGQRLSVVSTISDKISKATDALDDLNLPRKARELFENTKLGKEKSTLTRLVNAAMDGRISEAAQSMSAAVNPNKELGLMEGVLSELSNVSDTKYISNIFLRSAKVLENQRSLIADTYESLVNESFYDKTLLQDADTQKDITSLIMRSGIAGLLDSYKIKDVIELLNSDSKLNAEISYVTSQVLNTTRGHEKAIRAKQTAYFMLTGVGSAMQARNEHVILQETGLLTHEEAINELQEAGSENYNQRASEIKELILLNALKFAKDRMAPENLNKILKEANKGSKNGITSLLNITRLQEQNANKFFEEQDLSRVLGYAPDIVNQIREYTTNTNNPERKKELISKGWEYVSQYTSRDLNGNIRTTEMFRLGDSGKQRIVSGALPTSDIGTSGASIEDTAFLKGADVSQEFTEEQFYDNELNKFNAIVNDIKDPLNFDPKTYLEEDSDLSATAIPYFYETGLSFRIVNSHETKDTILERENNPSKLISRYAVQNFDKEHNIAQTEKVIKGLGSIHDTTVKNLETHQEIEIAFDAPTKRGREIYRSMPHYAQNMFNDLYDGSIMLDKRVVDTLFGYTLPSIAGALPEVINEQDDPDEIKMYNRLGEMFTKAVFGDKHVYRVNQINRFLLDTTALIKNYWVIRSGTTAVRNLKFNARLLIVAGVSPTTIVKEAHEAFKYAKRYNKDKNALLKAEANLALYPNNIKYRNLAASLRRNLEANPITEMLEKYNLMPSIVNDVALHTKNNEYSSQALNVVSEKYDLYMPDRGKRAVDLLYANPNTPIYNMLDALTGYGDFIGKYIAVKHKMRNKKFVEKYGEKAEEYAVEYANKLFINYDTPQQKHLEFLNRIGFLAFTKYLLRIQNGLHVIFQESPIGSNMRNMLLHISLGGNILDESLMYRAFEDGGLPFGFTLYDGLDVPFNPPLTSMIEKILK